jgi:hypothetical protein
MQIVFWANQLGKTSKIFNCKKKLKGSEHILCVILVRVVSIFFVCWCGDQIFLCGETLFPIKKINIFLRFPTACGVCSKFKINKK